MWISSFPSTVYWRDCLFSFEYSWFLCQILVGSICMSSFMRSQFCSLGLCVCFYANTVLFWLYSGKSGRVTPPALLFFLRITLAIQGLLWLHTNFRLVFSASVKRRHWTLDRDRVESVDGVGWYGHCNNINSSNPWTQDTFPFMCVFFDFFSAVFCGFQYSNLSPPWLNL